MDLEQKVVGIDSRALLGPADGIGSYTRELIHALDRESGYALKAMAHRPPHPSHSLPPAVEWETESALSGVIWQQWNLPQRLNRGDVDLFWSPLQTLPLRTRVPSVTTVHDLTTLLYPETHRLKVRLSQILFLGRSLAKAHRIVAISQATSRDLQRFFPQCQSKVRVIPNGVSSSFVPGDGAAIEQRRGELGCPDGYILFVGTLEPRKNLTSLLDAWEALQERGILVPLVCAGSEGWKNRALRSRMERLRSRGLLITGTLSYPDLIRTYQAATVFAYPSLYEGFGLPVAEAMGCGIPVVTSSTSSLPEVLGDAGSLVPPTDTAALADALEAFLKNPSLRQAAVEKGLERVARFTWDHAAIRMREVFQEVFG